jgi:ribulose-5-phosphate 4-epimerase/fuculose-1-phosphate aldolase
MKFNFFLDGWSERLLILELLLEHFWINPLSMHFSQIKVSDLVLVNEEGQVLLGGAQAAINGPAFAIHSEIHKARPDLNAACHAHSVYGKAFSCFGRVIEPLYQDALRFYNDLSGTYCF